MTRLVQAIVFFSPHFASANTTQTFLIPFLCSYFIVNPSSTFTHHPTFSISSFKSHHFIILCKPHYRIFHTSVIFQREICYLNPYIWNGPRMCWKRYSPSLPGHPKNCPCGKGTFLQDNYRIERDMGGYGRCTVLQYPGIPTVTDVIIIYHICFYDKR